ncbi:hypothetical protein PG997_014989 [Apiospora hydei]|uniref:Uncharacterized protein n=1 Tax=Apiospora hydei TaxID=1337664 RepID=A0ABR1UVH3_9PEZI
MIFCQPVLWLNYLPEALPDILQPCLVLLGRLAAAKSSDLAVRQEANAEAVTVSLHRDRLDVDSATALVAEEEGTVGMKHVLPHAFRLKEVEWDVDLKIFEGGEVSLLGVVQEVAQCLVADCLGVFIGFVLGIVRYCFRSSQRHSLELAEVNARHALTEQLVGAVDVKTVRLRVHVGTEDVDRGVRHLDIPLQCLVARLLVHSRTDW